MNKLFIKAPLVLGSICVVAAGLLGGANLLAKEYQKAHPVVGAPKDIKALDSAASFSKVDGFEPYKKSGILVQDAYLMAKNGNDRFGYAFTVDAGTPMSEPLAFTVAFSGDISEETVASVKPYAINVTTKGGYTNKAADYAAAVVSGKVAFDGSRDSFSVGAGGTVSTSALYKALTIARESYLGLWTGGGTGPVDDTLVAIQEIFETAESYSSAEMDVNFSYKDANKKTKNGSISKRYDVVLGDKSTAAVYYAETADTPYSEYGGSGKMEFMVGFSGSVTEGKAEEVRPAGYHVLSNTFTYTQWTGFADGLVSGSANYDDAIKNGATITSNAFRSAAIKMRDDYYERTLAAQKANVASAFPAIYGEDYDSFAADETFYAVEKALVSENGKYAIDSRYSVTLKSGTKAVAYRGKANCTIEQGPVSSTIIVGFAKSESGALIKGATIVEEENFSAKGYLDGVVSGTHSIDNEGQVDTGSTHTSKMVREMLVGMRELAVADLGE